MKCFGTVYCFFEIYYKTQTMQKIVSSLLKRRKDTKDTKATCTDTILVFVSISDFD